MIIVIFSLFDSSNTVEI